MKKEALLVILMVICFMVPAFAGSGAALFPRVEGQDVLVPHRLVKAIPGFNAKEPVYAACDINHWFQLVVSDKLKAETRMIREGDYWRARGLAGHRFHPVQLDKNGKPKWAKIEAIYPLDSTFVDMKGLGPCLLLKK